MVRETLTYTLVPAHSQHPNPEHRYCCGNRPPPSYVGLLYRSSICACVTFILFVFREQKMVQRMQEIVAKYEDRLRRM